MNNEHGSLMSKRTKEPPKKAVAKPAAKPAEKQRKLQVLPLRQCAAWLSSVLQVPIIMVPQGRTAVINLLNATELCK